MSQDRTMLSIYRVRRAIERDKRSYTSHSYQQMVHFCKDLMNSLEFGDSEQHHFPKFRLAVQAWQPENPDQTDEVLDRLFEEINKRYGRSLQAIDDLYNFMRED